MSYPYNRYLVWPFRAEGPAAKTISARSGSEALALAKKTYPLLPCPVVCPARLADTRLPRCLDPL